MVDSAGDVVISGTAFRKGFIASYTPDGVIQWTQQLTGSVFPAAAATDAASHLIIAGTIDRKGDRSLDAFLAKYGSAAP